MNKKQIREKIRSVRKNIPKEVISEKSRKIICALEELDEFRKASTIMPYLSLDIEVDTIEFIKKELKEQKRTMVVPFVKEDNIQVSRLSDFNDLSNGKFGVLEPIKKEEFKGKIDMILVPGIAFDQNGSRIGFGKGFYDRFLKNHKRALKIGLAFEEQIVDNIPIEEHDMPVDIILTEKRTIRCS